MSELQVPDFENLEAFKAWARSIKDKEIQSWTTKDWLKVYEKIDAYVDSPDFDKVYRDRLQGLIDNGILAGTKEDLTNPQNLTAYKRRAFIEMEDGGGDMICRFNRNYRFEPKQLEIIRDLGRTAGKQMVDKGVDLASLAIKTSEENTGELYRMMILSNDLTIENTAYKRFNSMYRSFFSVGIDNEMDSRGLATYEANNHRKLKLNSKKMADEGMHISFHEAAHLHMQNGAAIQKQLLSQNVMANAELGKDFYKLMQKNSDYYITPERAQRHVNSDLYNYFNDTQVRRISRDAYCGYHKQPMEKYSEIYGIEAERAFRKETKQLTERTAMRVADRISGGPVDMPSLPGMDKSIYAGRPAEVRHTGSGVELVYKSYDTEPEKLANKIKTSLKNMDEQLINDLNIRVNKTFGEVKLTVPNSYDFTSRYKKFETTPPIPPKTNKFANLKGLFTSSQAQAASNATKFEEKLVNKGAVSVAKATEKTVAKKSGVLAKAAQANAKFDAAVDKVIDKGAKKLNNSAVGKAYQKATTKVSESKVGKAVAKKTAKVTQKVAQKVATNAAGKAVGKVVAKTAATAVGKSVLKKIPLVSAAAGAYFAYDRLKNGDWKGACGEMASGIAGCFPGVGTAASVAIDAGLAAKDIHQVVKDNKKQVAQATPKAPAQPQKKVAPKDLSKQIAQRTETNKKTTQKTTVNTQQIAQAQQNSRA